MIDKMQLFDRISPQVYEELYRHTLARMRGDKERAYDVLQDALTKAMKQINQLQDETKFVHWLSVIVKNQAFEELRRTAARNKHSVYVSDDSEIDYLPTNKVRSAEDVALVQIELDTFRKYVDELPLLTQQIIMLHWIDKRTFREVSKLLGLPVEAIKARYYRAIQRYIDREGK